MFGKAEPFQVTPELRLWYDYKISNVTQYYDTIDLYSNTYIVKSCYPYHNLVFPNLHIRTRSHGFDFILIGKYITLSCLLLQSGVFLS